MEDASSQDIGHRTQRLEEAVIELRNIAVAIKAEATETRSILTELVKQVSLKQQTNWSVVLLAGGALLTFFVFYSNLTVSPIMERINIHRSELDRIEERNTKREREIGREEQKLQDVREHVMQLLKEGEKKP